LDFLDKQIFHLMPRICPTLALQIYVLTNLPFRLFFYEVLFDAFVKSQKINFLSFRRKPESSGFSMFWILVEDPVFSGDQVRHEEKGLFTNSSFLVSKFCE
jgi:hypothetical protein